MNELLIICLKRCG